jgi:hypothetical protein
MNADEKLRHALPVLKALASMSDTTIELVIPTQVRKQARDALDRIGEEYQVR